MSLTPSVWFSRLSLGARIALISVASSLLSALLLLVIAFDQLVDDFEQVVEQRQQLETRAYALEMDDSLRQRLDALELLGARMTDGTSLKPLPDIQQLLRQPSRALALFDDGVQILDAGAVVIAESQPVPGRLGTGYADRRHFKRAMNSGESTISHPIIGRKTGVPLLSFVAPIKSGEGQLLGLVSAAVPLANDSLLPHPEKTASGTLFKVLDTETFTQVDSVAHDGRILDLPEPGVDPLTDAALSGVTAGVVTGADGQTWIYATRHLDRVGWVLLQAVPFEQAVAPARASFQRFLTLSAALLLFVLIAVTLLSGAISQPLNRMASAIRRWLERPDSELRLDVSGPPEVRNLAIAFNQLMSERDSLDAVKDQFVATVSHELRTPLTAIGGALKLVHAGAGGALPEKAAGLVDIALRNSEQLQQLVSDLLDFSRAVNRQLSVDLVPVSVADALADAAAAHQTTAASRNVQLCAEPGPAAWVVADKHRLRQILDNYVSNAIRFSPADHSVQLFAAPAGPGRIRLFVADQGKGVPEAFRPRLFQRFAQAEPNTARGRAGTGLGLAICRELAELMDGEVGYRFREGAQFWVELPVTDQPEERNHGHDSAQP